MTREEQIANESLEYMMKSCIHDEIYDVDVRNAFEEGVDWADEHPKHTWINVKDDLPCNHQEQMLNENYTKKVLVVEQWEDNPSVRHVDVCDMSNKIGTFNVAFYWRNDGHYTVTHWMPMPILPELEK